MKRWLPFLIIFFVGLATLAGAFLFYRAKMQPAPTATTRPTPSPTAVAATGSPGAAPTIPMERPPEEPGQAPHIRGPLNAPVTMEVYGDFQCPSCRHASAMIRELEQAYPDRLRVIFYEFPLSMHKHAADAARAAEAAAIQGKFWEMHDALYEYQPVWSKADNVGFFFENYAESIGLDVARFRADMMSPDVQQTVISQGNAGAARGVQNTPTIFVNGRQMRSEFTREKLQEAIEAALAAAGKS